MKRLLIANRGEIALRIARTARELDIETVGIATEEDRALAEGYGCDAVAPLGGSGPAAYLDGEAIVALARERGCDALHPGYGFLSERADFAEACRAAEITFVGPPTEALALFGDKARAREQATRLGIAVLPGLPAPADVAAVRAFQEERIRAAGPDAAIVLKATAGGGGRGMRVVRAGDDLEQAHARCGSEALRAFGSAALFAEAWLERPRHLEVQVVADAHGAVQHLGERDCSLQRRHQKLVEIAPAPGLDASVRAKLTEAALSLTGSADYRGVGTIEFLLAPSGELFFMEANARLQVEHTITEEITGVDLVEVQLRLARGEPLGAVGLEAPPRPRGHAIQLRLLAERLDERGEARPSSGTLERFEMPSGPGIRIDTAMRAGLAPHPGFDPLLAKIIVSSEDATFDRVVRRVQRALAESRIRGVETNLGFLAALTGHERFVEARLDTHFIERHAAELVREAGTALDPGSPDEASRAEPSRPASATASEPAAQPAPEGLETIAAPLLGTVLEIAVAPNETVRAGQTLCILEAMKMEHVVAAPRSGRIERCHVRPGDVLGEGSPLFWLSPTGERDTHTTTERDVDLDEIRPDLAEVRQRHAWLQDASRPEAVERRRARGQRTARENLEALCDPESFVEYGGLAIAAQRRARPLEELQRRTPADAILTGLGTVNADRFGPEASRCAILIADATVLAGTQGFFHHHKIDRILELAERYEAPVVFLPEGGGGRPNDSDVGDISTAGLNVTSFHAFARLAGRVPRVSVVSGYCFAGSAAFAGCADVIIATRNTSLGMGGPAMIEGGGLGRHAPEEVGPVSVQEPNGVIDLLVEDEREAVDAARRYLGYFQGRESEWSCADQRRLRHLIPENRRRVYDVRAVIETLCDTGSVMELRRAFGVGMITALVRVEGHAFGLIANDPMHLGGAIDDVGSDKAARFIQLCDAFGLPVLSLCDTPGFMVGPEIEARAQVRKVSRLFVAGASLSVPLFTVILRKGYGLGAQAMAGGSFVAPVFTVAWPTGEIGGMGLEGAVDLGFQKQLAAQESEEARSALREKLIGALYDKGKALNAAAQLEFDAVIDPAETRSLLLRGLTAVGPIGRGSRRMVDTW